MEKTYYAIVYFGVYTIGRTRRYYRSLSRAIRDANELDGGTLMNVRITRCRTRQEAIDADISDAGNIVWRR